MVTLALPEFGVKSESEHPFWGLFPHRFDYICAPHPEPGLAPNWQTESRHPLTDRMLHQGSYLYGVRFGAKTQYCLLDIDADSAYHPQSDPFAIQRVLAALESIGLVAYLACTSSSSGGLHLYFPFLSPQSAWEVGTVVTVLLENAGFAVKPGQLEVFPNRRSYSIQGKPSLFNAHRLPLQMGSYLLNRDFEPVWSDQHRFVQQWQTIQAQNEMSGSLLHRVLKQSQRRHYQVSGKAAKFINDLNAEIELGWTGSGQTNYLLGRITMRAYIFHHILEGTQPLEGQALVDEIVATARSLPGYQEWCQHQHEIEHRASEWARCIESSRYFHYGDLRKQAIGNEGFKEPDLPSWNQKQLQSAREKIRSAIADLLEKNTLPVQATARFKLLTSYGIGGSSLYRHKDLWHPEFLTLNDPITDLDLAQSTNRDSLINPDNSDDLKPEPLKIRMNVEIGMDRSVPEASQYSTSLLPTLGRNPLLDQDLSRLDLEIDRLLGRNLATAADFTQFDPSCPRFMNFADLGTASGDQNQPGDCALDPVFDFRACQDREPFFKPP